MSKYNGPSCRLCKREGVKLYIKGEKCHTDKCPMEKRPYPPGMHKNTRVKNTDYRIRLREKQKAKRVYGLTEKQFKSYVVKANRQKGVAGVNLLMLLERRLDNVVFRMGFFNSRSQARQYVSHRHILVNGKIVNIPSFLVKEGDLVEIKEKSKKNSIILENIEQSTERGFPHWVDVEPEKLKGTFSSLPTREDLNTPEIEEQLIIEFYSR